MITFTPLSGAAHSSQTTPLAYLLKVDDVQILLDCGSPDWCPERPSSSAVKEEDIAESSYHWEQYCNALRECVLSCIINLPLPSLRMDEIHVFCQVCSPGHPASYSFPPFIDFVLIDRGANLLPGVLPLLTSCCSPMEISPIRVYIPMRILTGVFELLPTQHFRYRQWQGLLRPRI